MNDQAASLRAQMAGRLPSFSRPVKPQNFAKIITVASGKGGVGKSNFCVNFALGLREKGLRVLVIDTDVGFANIEVLLNVKPSHTLLDIVAGKELKEIVQMTSYGLPFISGGNGAFDASVLGEREFQNLLHELKVLSEVYDVILLDCGAGVNSVSRELVSASDELILVTTPEPTSMTDAYAFMKLLSAQTALPRTRMVINRAGALSQAVRCAETLTSVAVRFLKHDVETLGYILEDISVSHSVMHQVPVLQYAPRSRVTACYRQVARNYVQQYVKTPRVGVSGFFERLLLNRRRGGA